MVKKTGQGQYESREVYVGVDFEGATHGLDYVFEGW